MEPQIQSVQQFLSQLHLITIYIPIWLFTMGLICDLLNAFGKKWGLMAGHWLIILGALSCIPAIMTGLALAQNLDPKLPFLEEHRYWGYVTGTAASLYAGLRISAMIWKIPLRPRHYIALSLLMLALVILTCDYGLLML